MLSVIFWIIVILVLLAFSEYIIQAAVFIGFFMGVGAFLFWWLFDDSSLGATVGFWFGVFIGLKMVLQSLGAEYATIFEYGFYLLSLPFWFLNRLQHILTEPWRYMFKTSWLGEGVKPILRPMLFSLQVTLYIVTTPLRLLNAFIYNVLVYGITELYDLFAEVFMPSSWKEGRDGWWQWLYMFPWRLIKYPLFHGSMVVLEGTIWTAIDIVIPAVTLYHGTDLTAGRAITRKTARSWTEGTFTASQSSWGGIGVYFASRRAVARRYAEDPCRLNDTNPVMIVCRVSLGRIINYSLAPFNVYLNAGATGNPAVLNNYGQKNGYTTGEWWNQRGGYWEYCLFDWQNRYNHPWRIRPVFVFNFRTGRAQHIDSGLRHWLFSKVVIEDILENSWFCTLVVIATIVAIWFLLYGWTYLYEEYLWHYFI